MNKITDFCVGWPSTNKELSIRLLTEEIKPIIVDKNELENGEN